MNLEGERASGKLLLRYEDVVQDGRMMLQTLPVALGVIWRAISLPTEARRAMRKQGILPIMTRYLIESGPGPFAVENPLEVQGDFKLAHSVDRENKVDRLYLDMEANLTAPIGRTNLPAPDDAGTSAFVGKIRAEHVFTKPFAPAAERKVLSLAMGGEPFVPKAQRAWKAPETTLTLENGAPPIDATYTEDPVSFALGVMHTDSNQHVNSLVYPRIFEEAALRRFKKLGRSTSVLARHLDISYRRPSFAGDTLRIFVRAFDSACTGYFFGENDDMTDVSKARAFVQMRFE
ncbi:MAG: acyl-CoA thioesterase [Polyangiaceae bacterium]